MVTIAHSTKVKPVSTKQRQRLADFSTVFMLNLTKHLQNRHAAFKQPNDPKSHGHGRLAHACNLDSQISCLNLNLKGQWPLVGKLKLEKIPESLPTESQTVETSFAFQQIRHQARRH